MRKGILLAVASVVAATSVLGTSAWGQAVPAEFDTIFAGGGTPLTNGIFFPGTATCRGDECTPAGAIPQVTRGTEITFTNVDEGTVSNAHRIICLDRTKRGRPRCVSEQLDSPGESSTIATSRLKPKVYYYYCPVHTGMYGVFEVVAP